MIFEKRSIYPCLSMACIGGKTQTNGVAAKKKKRKVKLWEYVRRHNSLGVDLT